MYLEKGSGDILTLRKTKMSKSAVRRRLVGIKTKNSSEAVLLHIEIINFLLLLFYRVTDIVASPST